MVVTYLGHEDNAFLLGRVQVAHVKGDHHFAQEGVPAQAAVVPHGDGQGLVRQLLATDGVLVEREGAEDERYRGYGGMRGRIRTSGWNIPTAVKRILELNPTLMFGVLKLFLRSNPLKMTNCFFPNPHLN